MPLPQIQVLDVNQPVQNYLAGQQRQRQEGIQNTLMRQKQEDRARTQGREDIEFGQQQEDRILKNAATKLKSNIEMQESLTQGFISLDETSPDFQTQKEALVDSAANMMSQSGAFAPEEIRALQKHWILTGTPEMVKARKIELGVYPKAKAEGSATFAPSPLKKLINERQALINAGANPEDQEVQAYDNRISGTEIDIDDMTPDEIDMFGQYFNLTGKVPSLGRGKQATKIRGMIAKSAARQALGADEDGVPDVPDKTPAEAALGVVASQADTKAIQGSMNFLEKQIGSMGSFVTNIGLQVDKVKTLSKDLETYDTRLLNVPLRMLRGKILGSPLQAKYDMYLTEIEAEIGKLATGSSGSIAELSATAQEKWAKIHDKNLSVKDMLLLLDETRAAAQMRMESVDQQLTKTRKRMRTREFGVTTPTAEGWSIKRVE